MKPLHTRFLEFRKQLSIPWGVLERDYVLSWILAGIARVDTLRNTLVLKGGTALKKCYFGEYRFSEDLDFSTTGAMPTGEAMEHAIQEACYVTAKLLDEYAPVRIECERYVEKEPHPGGQEAFTIRAQLPWQKQPHTRVWIEIAADEKVLRPFEQRTIIHEYGEPLNARVTVYSLEEIVAEKLRAILQHAEKFEQRGWVRSRARDYYDLWRVLGTYKDEMTFSGFADFLIEKCEVRGVEFNSSDDFFHEAMLTYVEKTWDQWLAPLVPNLPAFETVISGLRPQISAILVSDRS
jgi:predicted nucleotidyltransferase component of viral defense system